MLSTADQTIMVHVPGTLLSIGLLTVLMSYAGCQTFWYNPIPQAYSVCQPNSLNQI